MQNRFTRPLSTLFLTATVCASTLVAQTNQSPSEDSSTPTYRSNVSEVRLVFFATDEHNHAVEELQKDDFAVVDNEMVIRDFRSFARLGLTRLDVIVLMDSSESVLPHFEEEIGDVEQLISESPWSPEDNLSVLAFSRMEAHFVCVGNCRSTFAADGIAFLPRGGATPLFDAIEIAANFLIQRRQPDVWPVIILFSDGDDTISKTSFREALKKIRVSEAQVYAIDLNPPDQLSNGSAALQMIADESGGPRVPITEGAARIFNDVISDLHSARVVTYVRPQSNSDFHSVRIFPTHNLKWQFRCRRGYYSHSGGERLEDGP